MTRQRVPNAELYRDTARQNLLTNGGFEIWQRGNGPFTTNGAYTADRWSIGLGAGDTVSVVRGTGNPDIGSLVHLTATYTKSTGPTLITQQLTGADLYVIAGRTVTVSVRIKGTVASSVRLRLNDGVTGIQYSSYHSGGGAYETITLTYAVAIATTGLAINIEFNASGTYYIDNAMLVVGNVAADYAPLHPADDLARCLRYYEIIGRGGLGYPRLQAVATAAGQNFSVSLAYKAVKPVTPTTTKNGTWNATNCIQPAPAGSPATDGTALVTNSSASGQVDCYPPDVTCFISVEANP